MLPENKVKVKLTMLNADHGDAFIIRCSDGDEKSVVVVDGGPASCASEIADIYDREDHINLLILTHYDEDHIAGVIEYVRRHVGREVVDEYWCNCAANIDFAPNTKPSKETPYKNAETLATYLRQQNKVWKERIVVPKENEPKKLTEHIQLYILSPQEEALKDVLEIKEDVLRSMYHGDDLDDTTKPSKDNALADSKNTIEDLAKTDKPRSLNIINTSSIAFLLCAPSGNILMLGDADIEVVSKSLKGLGFSKDKKLDVKYLKLSHHGSKNNISYEFLSLVNCQNFLISTNGGKLSAYHPDRKTLAIIVKDPTRKQNTPITFYINNKISQVEKRVFLTLSKEEQVTHHCDIIDNQFDL